MYYLTKEGGWKQGAHGGKEGNRRRTDEGKVRGSNGSEGSEVNTAGALVQGRCIKGVMKLQKGEMGMRKEREA